LADRLKNAKGFVVVAFECNYQIPPVLTNVIAWISRIGDYFRAIFSEKPALIATHSGGGGTAVLNAMRTIYKTRLGCSTKRDINNIPKAVRCK
jgi:NAD(P)H-dependent FMN reductase